MSLYQKQKAEEEGGEQNWILRIWLAHIFIKYTTAIIAMPYVLYESTYSGEKSRFWILDFPIG